MILAGNELSENNWTTYIIKTEIDILFNETIVLINDSNNIELIKKETHLLKNTSYFGLGEGIYFNDNDYDNVLGPGDGYICYGNETNSPFESYNSINNFTISLIYKPTEKTMGSDVFYRTK